MWSKSVSEPKGLHTCISASIERFQSKSNIIVALKLSNSQKQINEMKVPDIDTDRGRPKTNHTVCSDFFPQRVNQHSATRWKKVGSTPFLRPQSLRE